MAAENPQNHHRIDQAQQQLEAARLNEQSKPDLKQQLTEYRQVYLNQVDSGQALLKNSKFSSKEAKDYSTQAISELQQKVESLASEG